MYRVIVRNIYIILLPALVAGLLLLGGCENDLKKIKAISEQQLKNPADSSKGVEVLFSDSAKLKLKLTAPLMLQYTTVPKPYMEMPKGVKAIFYDDSLRESTVITADYAWRRESEKLIVLRKNVVATNKKGDVFKSDELIWNEMNRKVTSSKPVTIITSNGSVINGSSLLTNDRFDPWEINATSGLFHVDQDLNGQ